MGSLTKFLVIFSLGIGRAPASSLSAEAARAAKPVRPPATMPAPTRNKSRRLLLLCIDLIPSIEALLGLASKLLLHLIAVVVLLGVNLPMIGQPFGFAELGDGACIALLVCCVNWLVSSIQSSPTLATMSGFATLGLIAMVIAMLEEWTRTSNESGWLHVLIWLSVAIGCVIPIVCFCVGTWYYLHDSKP